MFSLVNESLIKTVKIVHFMLFLNLVHTMKHSINLLLKFPVKLINLILVCMHMDVLT
jgi:hypothetical protein